MTWDGKLAEKENGENSKSMQNTFSKARSMATSRKRVQKNEH